MSQIKNLKQSFSNQLSKTGKTIFDSAIRYKKDKKDLFLSYFEYTLTQPKKFDKYLDITKTGFKNFITKSQSKTFVYNLGWRYEDKKENDFRKFLRQLTQVYNNQRIVIIVNADKKYQFTFKLSKNKIGELMKKLIYGNSLVRPLIGFPEDIYNKYNAILTDLASYFSSPNLDNNNVPIPPTQIINEMQRLESINQTITYQVVTSNPLSPAKIKQKFKAGGFCFFDAIIKHLEDKTDFQSKSIVNETIRQKENYKDGVNIKDAETIGKLLNISFKLYSPDQKAYIDINTTKNNYYQIPLINNTSNHVELFKQKEVEVTTEEINKLIFQLFKKKQYHMFPASKQIKYLYTVDTKYINIDDKIKDELFDDFIKPLKNLKILYNSELHKFIDQAYSQGTTIVYTPTTTINDFDLLCGGGTILDFNDKKFKTTEETYLYDHSKSYSRYKETKYYQQFPTVFVDFSKSNFTEPFIKSNVGIYQISNVDITNVTPNIQSHVNQLKLFDHNIFTSPELIFFSDLNIKFDIVAGAYCKDTIDINFSQEVINQKLYSDFIGKLASINLNHTYKVFATEKFGTEIKSEFDSDIYSNQDYVDVEYPKSNVSSLTHISAFFTAYSRIQILEQLFNIPYENVNAIQLDGIFTNKKINTINNFELKYTPPRILYDCEYYISGRSKDTLYTLPDLPEYITNKNQYLLGAGGTGKTHSILTKYKHLKILYLSKCYALGYDKSKEYNVNYSVFDVFKSKPTETYIKFFLNQPPPNIIFLDEFSMTSDNFIPIITHYFPYSKLIIANDINTKGRPYQLSLEKNIYKIPKDYHITEFTTNYRIKCDKLKLLALKVRNLIDLGLPALKLIEENIQRITKDELINLYNYKTDYILTSLKKGYDEHTNYVEQYSKLFNSPKFLITQNKHPYFNGQITLDPDLKIQKEQRDAFTAHAIQGQTIKNPSKIFIDTRNLFDINQIYVMISRAEYISQIYLI